MSKILERVHKLLTFIFNVPNNNHWLEESCCSCLYFFQMNIFILVILDKKKVFFISSWKKLAEAFLHSLRKFFFSPHVCHFSSYFFSSTWKAILFREFEISSIKDKAHTCKFVAVVVFLSKAKVKLLIFVPIVKGFVESAPVVGDGLLPWVKEFLNFSPFRKIMENECLPRFSFYYHWRRWLPWMPMNK